MAQLVSSNDYGITDERSDGNAIVNPDVLIENKSSHLEEKFICDICERSFNRKDTLKRHTLTHGPKQIKCSVCKEEFTNLEEKYSHIEQVHGKPLKRQYSPEFKVDAVKKLKEVGLLEASRVLGLSESILSEWQRYIFNPLYCAFCGKCFARESYLKLHEEKDHNTQDTKQEEFQCDKCSRIFPLSDLKRHMAKCGITSDVICDICQKKFAKRKGLRDHIRFVHEKEKNFCCEFCTKTFARSNTLTQHIKDVHEQSGDFACGFCDKKYFKMRDKVVHERKHTGEKPFQCACCGESCSRYKAKKTDFKCEKCNGVLEQVLQLYVPQPVPENTDEKDKKEKEPENKLIKAITERETTNTGLRELFLQKYAADDGDTDQTDIEDLVKAEMKEASDSEVIENDTLVQEVKEETVDYDHDDPMVQHLNVGLSRELKSENISLECTQGLKPEDMVENELGIDSNESDEDELVDESYLVQTMKESKSSYSPLTNYLKDENVKDMKDVGDNFHSIIEETFMENGESMNIDTVKKEIGEKARIACNLCSTTFSRRKGLLQHIRFVHQKEKNFVCTICDKRFSWKNSLTTHVTDIHEQSGSFACNFCEKRYFKERDLKRHESKHSNEKPHQCDHCGESFKKARNLLEHLKSHLGLKTRDFQCVECGKQFGTKGVLERHVQSLHVNEFPCGICESKFLTNRLLEEHMKFHMGARVFKCYDCGREYISNRSLKKHAYTVHLNEPCKLCDNQVNDEFHLEEHLKSEARKNKPKRQKKEAPNAAE